MSLILILSILIRLAALGWSVVLLRRVRDWRMGFLTLMLALMALRQILTLLATHTSWAVTLAALNTEWPGLIVSVMAFLVVFFLERLFTDRSRAEAKIKLLAEALRSTSEAVSITDVNDHILFVNQAFLDIYGYAEDEVIGQPITCLRSPEHPPEEDPTVVPPNERAHWQGELWNRRKDGTAFPIALSTGVVEGEEEQAIAFIGIITDITERKRAGEVLEQSKQRLRLALDVSNDGLWDWNVQTGYVFFSDRWCQSLGYAPDEVEPHVSFWEKSVHPDDLPRVLEAVNTHFEKKTALYECENRLRTKAGDYRPNLDRGKVVAWDEEGKPLRMIGVDIDITERKQVEEQETRLGRIFEDSLNEIYLFDAETLRFVQVNRGARKNLGYSLEELCALTPVDLKPEFTPETFAAFLEPLRTGAQEQIDFTTVHRRKDGSLYPVEVHLQLSVWGVSTVFAAFVLDITKRKHAEEALTQSEHKYRQLVELAQEGIWAIDQEANTTFVNASMAKMLGYTPDEMQGKPLFSFMDEPGVALAQYNLARREEGITEQHDFEFIHKDGRRLYALIETAPILDEDGTYQGAIAGIVDITQRKQAEEALRKKEAFLAQAHRIAGIGTWEWDVPTDTIYWSDQTYHLLGLAPQSLTPDTDTFLRYVHPDDLATVQDNLAALFEHGKAAPMEYRIVQDDGSVRWFFAEGMLDVDAEGRPLHMISTIQDITERKQAETTLRENQSLLSLALRTAQAGAWNWDIKTNHVTWSDENYIVLGLTPGSCEASYEVWLGCVHPGDRETTQQHIAQALEQRQDLNRDYRIIWPDGTIRWINDKGKLVLDDQGEPTQMYGFQIDITERKHAEEALQASEEFNRRIVEAIPSGIVHVSMQGAILYANDEAQRILGLSYDALTASYVADFEPRTLWEDGSPCPVEDYPVSQCLQTGVAQPPVTIGVQRPDGAIMWAVYTAVPLLDPETQQVNGAVVTFLDITERKHAAEALQASEARNRALLNGIPDMMFRLHTDGTFLDYKAEPAEELAIPAEAIIGSSLDDMPMPAPIVKDLMRCIEQAITTDEVQTYEYELAVPIGVQAYEARIVRSGIDEVVCIIRNVTARKRAEAQLREREKTYRLLVESAPYCIHQIDLQGRLSSMNSVGLAMMNASDEEEIKGLPYLDVVAGDDQPRIGALLDAALRGEASTFEFEATNGHVFASSFIPIFNEQGAVDRLMGLTRDVTERKHAETEQARLIDELEARNAELERFTYTVSHDLKTPLVTIKGFLGLLMKDLKAGNKEAVERDAEHISRAADRMRRLLDELLELSRIGRVVNPSEEVSLTELAQVALELVVDQIDVRGVTVALAPNLPVVFGDRVRLLEVFQNLVDNAIKFMGPQPNPCIEIGSRKDGHEVVCYVQDNGVGIAPPYHEQVFGLFNRLSLDVEGTGIGLALVKRIVEMHGGRVWVESEGEGQGSAFCFTFPG